MSIVEFSRTGGERRLQILTGRIGRVFEGKRHRERLEIEIVTEREGKSSVIEAYLWARNTKGELLGSLLLAAQHTEKRFRFQIEESWWGLRVVWADVLEASAA